MTLRSTVHLVFTALGVCLLAAGLVLSHGGSLDELGQLCLGLAVVLTAAIAGGHLAVRAGQPAVLGELLAGILIGNLPGLGILQFLGTDRYLDILSQVGMLLLLFEVGLGLSIRDFFAVGTSSFLVAVPIEMLAPVPSTATRNDDVPTANRSRIDRPSPTSNRSSSMPICARMSR